MLIGKRSATPSDPEIFQRPATQPGSLLFGAPRPRDPANPVGGHGALGPVILFGPGQGPVRPRPVSGRPLEPGPFRVVQPTWHGADHQAQSESYALPGPAPPAAASRVLTAPSGAGPLGRHQPELIWTRHWMGPRGAPTPPSPRSSVRPSVSLHCASARPTVRAPVFRRKAWPAPWAGPAS